jgi:hypothetical protein
MRVTAFAVLFLSVITLYAQDNYFPKDALSSYDRVAASRARWYSDQLRALDERSLLEAANNPSVQSYRFVWLRTFHHPVTVRLDIRVDGTGELTSKIASGAGGYKPGKLIENKSRILSKEQTNKFLDQVKDAGFWELPSYEENFGVDGSQWIIEGVKDGKYHVVDRWTPAKGPVRDLGAALAFTLAELKIPKDELY